MPSDFFDLVKRRGARQQNHQVGMLDAGDPDFLAVDDVAVATPYRRGFDLGGVSAGAGLSDPQWIASVARRWRCPAW